MAGLPRPEIVADAIVAAVAAAATRAYRRRRAIASPRSSSSRGSGAFADLVFGDARMQRRLNRDARAAREGARGSRRPR